MMVKIFGRGLARAALPLVLLAGGTAAGAAPHVASVPDQPVYHFKKYKPDSGSISYQDINAKLQVIARVFPKTGNITCSLIAGTGTVSIADPNGSTTQCYGISDTAAVVGFYNPGTDPNTEIGLIYQDGGYTDFIAAGSIAANGGTELDGISPNGRVIVGTYTDSAGHLVSFTLKGGKQREVKVPGAHFLVPGGVNDAGDVTIQSFNHKQDKVLNSYLVSGETVTTIAFPGGTDTAVHGVNDAGVVVGAYTDQAGLRHGFTYDSAAQTYAGPFDAPNTAATGLLGINKKGVVCGYARTNGGTNIGIIGKPRG